MAEKEEEQITLDLDAVMEEGQERFEGELKEAASTPGETPAPDESIPAKEEKEKEKTEHPEETERTEDRGQRTDKEEKPEKPAKEVKEETPKKKEEEKPPEKVEVKEEEKPSHRFEDHDKAEEGYRGLQGEKTRVDQELKKSRERIKELEDAGKIKEEREKADKDFNEFAIDKNKEALKAIEELDPDDDEYQEDVAKIWAKKDGEISAYVREHPGLAAGGPEKEEGVETEADETTEAQKHVKELAKKADIDPEDEYFKLVCQQAPTEDEQGKPMDFDQQIEWAINKTKNYVDRHKQGFQKGLEEAAEEKSKKEQEAALPLGKGGKEKPTGEADEVKPVSLDDAIESALEERRV